MKEVNSIELTITAKDYFKNRSTNWEDYMTDEQKELFIKNKHKETFKVTTILGTLNNNNPICLSSYNGFHVYIIW